MIGAAIECACLGIAALFPAAMNRLLIAPLKIVLHLWLNDLLGFSAM
jgi:hypothetical protein